MKERSPGFAALLASCIAIVLCLAGCSREQQASAPASGRVPKDGAVVDQTTLLATIGARNDPAADGSSSGKSTVALVLFHDRGWGAAYVEEQAGAYQVVFNGRADRPVESIDQVRISPDGKRIAYSAMVDGAWYMVVDGRVQTDTDEIGVPVFSPDSRHVAYEARKGSDWLMVVDGAASKGRVFQNGMPVFSSDSRKIAYVQQLDAAGKMQLVISDLAFKTIHGKTVAGKTIIANRDNSRIAAVQAGRDQKKRVIHFSFDRPDVVSEGRFYDAVQNITFGPDGMSVAYVAVRKDERFLVLDGREERLPPGDPTGPVVIRPDGTAAGVIMQSNGKSSLHQAFFGGRAERRVYDEAADLVFSGDGGMHAYTARSGTNWFVVVNGKDGPVFDRVVTPSFSPDGTRVVYRARKDGKRFVVVADASGRTVGRHSDYEQVFPVTFTADGRSVAYGVKDGQKLVWKVEKLQ